MEKIKISVNAERTDIDGQFKGKITFENAKNGKEVFEFIATNPSDRYVDVKYFNDKDSFHLKGMPSETLINGLTESQKIIFCLSVELLADTLENSEKIGLSHETTQLAKEFGGIMEVSGEMSASVEVDESMYKVIFENKAA